MVAGLQTTLQRAELMLVLAVAAFLCEHGRAAALEAAPRAVTCKQGLQDQRQQLVSRTNFLVTQNRTRR